MSQREAARVLLRCDRWRRWQRRVWCVGQTHLDRLAVLVVLHLAISDQLLQPAIVGPVRRVRVRQQREPPQPRAAHRRRAGVRVGPDGFGGAEEVGERPADQVARVCLHAVAAVRGADQVADQPCVSPRNSKSGQQLIQDN